MAHGVGQRDFRAIDHAEFDRLLQITDAAAVADDFVRIAQHAQRTRQRTADQSDADDADFIDHA